MAVGPRRWSRLRGSRSSGPAKWLPPFERQRCRRLTPKESAGHVPGCSHQPTMRQMRQVRAAAFAKVIDRDGIRRRIDLACPPARNGHEQEPDTTISSRAEGRFSAASEEAGLATISNPTPTNRSAQSRSRSVRSACAPLSSRRSVRRGRPSLARGGSPERANRLMMPGRPPRRRRCRHVRAAGRRSGSCRRMSFDVSGASGRAESRAERTDHGKRTVTESTPPPRISRR